nr:reverse transcriptase domain-containing protein [Tanacetum cinerariifolium]
MYAAFSTKRKKITFHQVLDVPNDDPPIIEPWHSNSEEEATQSDKVGDEGRTLTTNHQKEIAESPPQKGKKMEENISNDQQPHGTFTYNPKSHEQSTHEIAFSSHDLISAYCNGDDPLVIKAYIKGQSLWPLGVITLPLTIYDYSGRGSKTIVVDFMVVQAPSPYNAILGRPGMKKLRAIASTLHSLIKFPI